MVLIGAAWLLIAAGPDEPKGVATLGWMAGHWSTEGAGAWTEERWAPARGGVMLGTNLSGEGEHGGRVSNICGSPRTPTAWSSSGDRRAESRRSRSNWCGQAPGEAVFENPAHDYPDADRLPAQRRNTLVATVSGPDGANAQSWTFKRR